MSRRGDGSKSGMSKSKREPSDPGARLREPFSRSLIVIGAQTMVKTLEVRLELALDERSL